MESLYLLILLPVMSLRTQAVAFLDICLLLASQQYEDERTTTAGFMEEGDQLLLLASQQYKFEAIATVESPETSTSARGVWSVNLHFSSFTQKN